ncbi:MAG: hypothetical protein BGO98_22175 [Myxococcales bacterium 68-20]|nr:hypothetical protein [Myxococcales bacterium]OJY15158.1 MAG: hypothetical protein BGO98_22175 [Myxococcales bacterium 68-20]
MKAVALVGAILCCAAVAACSLAMASELDDAREPVPAPLPGQPDADSGSASLFDGGADPGADAAVRKRGCRELDPPPQFCEDFDDGELGENWDALEDAGGTIAFDSLAYSAPRSARISLVEAPSCSSAFFQRGFSGIGTNVVDVRVQMRPSSPWNAEYTPLAIVFSSDCVVFINARPVASGAIGSTVAAILHPNSSDTGGFRSLAGGLRVDEWTDVRISAVRQGSGAAITFAFERADGTLSETTESVAECTLGGDLMLGVGYQCGAGTSETRYDDVRVYWK